MTERRVNVSWLAAIGMRLFAIVPGPTALIILASLASQIALILAFLLPLKIVMLMGSGRVPRYFPGFLRDIEQNDLVIMLSGGAIVLYLVHLLANMIQDRLSALGAERVARANRKLSMFSNQEKLLRRTYERFARMCSGGLFALIAFGVLFALYPTLAIFVFAQTLIVAVVVITALRLSPRVKDGYESNRAKVTGAIGNFLFLSAFGMLVQQFLTGALPNGLIAILSLILVRQLFSRLGTAINDGINLISQRQRIDVLFFADQVLLPKVPKQLRQYWSLLDEERLCGWPKALLSDLFDETVDPLVVSWFETGEPGSQGLILEAGSDEGSARYMVKVYAGQHRRRSINERDLLAALPSETELLPDYIGSGEAEGFACNVFRWNEPTTPTRQELKTLEAECLPHLWAIEPPTALIDVYRRTHMMLTDRIGDILPARLRQVARLRGDAYEVETFEHRLPALIATLEALPLIIVNPDLKSSLKRERDGRIVAMNWGRWSLDPVGAGWDIDGDEHPADLSRTLAAAAQRRAALADVNPNDAWLASALFALVRDSNRERYQSVLDLIAKINRGARTRERMAG